MSVTSRRGFLVGVVALAIAAPLLQAANFGTDIPKLWGDGVHDDTTALQALIAGKPVFSVTRQSVIEPSNHIRLDSGTYLLSNTLVLHASNRSINIRDCTFIRGDDFPYGESTIKIREGGDLVFNYNKVIGNQASPGTGIIYTLS